MPVNQWQTDNPPKYERCLIYVQFDRFTYPKVMVGWHDGSTWKWENGSISGTVTHWQPLPVPPNQPLTKPHLYPRCECGHGSTPGDFHSDDCPLYKPRKAMNDAFPDNKS